MKTVKLFATLLVLSFLSAGIVSAEEKTKEFHESWPVSEVGTLQILNKFGEIKINNDGGSEVTIDVKVTVEGANEKKANELLDLIEVNFSKSGSTVKAETEIESDFKSQKHFSIDYVVNIPSDKNLVIENKYGNTIVNKLTGNGNFEIKYGNLTASELMTPAGGSLSVELAYGNATIGKATDINVDVSYSPMTIDELNSLKLESRYSSLEVEEAGKMVIESKYDKFNFGKVKSVDANFKYSNLKIGKLSKSLKIESGYGGVKVDEIASNFEFINVTNSYGQIALGLGNASYSIDASCNYCGIDYPEDDFSGDRIKENNSNTVKGKVGSGEGGKVYVRSRYGEIKLKY